MKPRTLQVLVADSNAFSRGLIGEILRSLNVTNISSARSEEMAANFLIERPTDMILVSWEEGDAFDGLGFVRKMRKHEDDRIRRLPVVLITAGLTRQMVINGRDAGVDEFLAKPISPMAMRQRLEMVVETPRPFIDCNVFLGPCRRRKNPADYYGAKRRAGERVAERPAMIDQDEVAAQTPIRLVLSQLRQTCAHLRASRPEALAAAIDQLRTAKEIAIETKDHALHAGLASFESYVGVATPLGQLEEPVITTALTALEQLAALPQNYAEARDSVAIALGKAIQKKLAA
ncbi:MAG TPA: response regulator [Hyphomonadaceae bacterium]|nr:response regulator [Hyphomonadaceae bacterium]HPI50400.1 response regulator [Hyphomonadaceae bacterium]